MNKIASYGLRVTGYAVLLAFAFSGCAKKENVLAIVGNQVITKTAFDEKIAKLPAPYQRMAQARKKEFLEEMILEILLVNEAERRQLQNDKEVLELFDQAKRKILIAKLVDNETKKIAKVSDDELRAYYGAHKDEFALPERFRASHIMVDTQKEAEEILSKLKTGAPFEELAKERSKDPSKEKSGDIDYFTKGQLLPEFEDAAVGLNIGELSGVVKTPIGYHIIKLTDKQDARIASFDEVKQKIEAQLLVEKRKEALDNLVKNLKEKARIKVNEALLGESRPEEAKP